MRGATFSNLTPEQQIHKERLRRYITRERLASCMNDSKWRAAISAVGSVAGYRARFRVRMVTDQNESPDQWDGSFPWHIPTPASIEWLELDPVVRTPRGQLIDDACKDFTELLSQALLQARIPFSIEAGMLRIWGYIRPGTSPNFTESEAEGQPRPKTQF